MSRSPEKIYTLADVQRDPGLREHAQSYLDRWEGNFSFLLNMQEKYLGGDQLSDLEVRKVLNCMRQDFKEQDNLPTPNWSSVDYPPKKKKKKKTPVCTIKGPHYQHSLGGRWPYATCYGIPFPINRPERFTVKVNIKKPFVKARTGAMIHRTLEAGRAWWRPHPHEWGWRSNPELLVSTMCKYPSVIKDGGLLTADEAAALVAATGKTEKPIVMCPYCEEEVSNEGAETLSPG